MIKCPKCQYERSEKDDHVMQGVCPACGIVYHKWKNVQDIDNQAVRERVSGKVNQAEDSLLKRIFQLLLSVPEKIDPVVYWGRVIIYLIFFIWGWYFITAGISW